jgi:hypothetical protein
LRRIRKQEKELAILRRIPVADYITMEILKQDNNAKTIQKIYQKHLMKTDRGHLIKKGKGFVENYRKGGVYTGGLAEVKKKTVRESLKKGDFWSEKSAAVILEEQKAARHAEKLFKRVSRSVTEPSARHVTDTGMYIYMCIYM